VLVDVKGQAQLLDFGIAEPIDGAIGPHAGGDTCQTVAPGFQSPP
jgi:hypothetical protein